MDTLLYDGDHYRDARGLPVKLTGQEELIQRILIRLQVKKGSFLLDPTLGSELHRLRRDDSERNNRLAMGYVQEALAALPGVEVREVHCALCGREDLTVRVLVGIDGQDYELEVLV